MSFIKHMENSEQMATSPVETPSNQYLINNVQQLFSLNQNLVNFKCAFEVNSLSKEPFLGIVVDQQTLDSGEKIEFKSADQGYLSGEMIQDNDVQTNWYLLLKSTKPNRVTVNVQTVPVPSSQVKPVQKPSQMVRPQMAQPLGSGTGTPQASQDWISYLKENKYIVIAIAVALAGGYYYYYYKYLPNKNKSDPKSEERQEKKRLVSSLKPEKSSSDHSVKSSPARSESSVGSKDSRVSKDSKVSKESKHSGSKRKVVVSDKAASELGDDLLKKIDNLKIPKV